MNLRHIAVTSLSIVLSACGSNSDDGSGSTTPKCTITAGGNLMYCYDFSAGYPNSSVGAVCDIQMASTVGARVSSCPSENIVGTCTVKSTCGGTPCSYDWNFYGSTKMTCEGAKEICLGANPYTNGVASSTFAEKTCGTNAGGFAGVDVSASPTTSTGHNAATCILSAGAITSNVPCGVSMELVGAPGQNAPFSVTSDDSGHAFDFFVFSLPAKAGTYINDGSRKVTGNAHDRASREWDVYDAYTGEPEMGSYTLRLTEVTMTYTSSMATTWSVHGSLDVSLDPFKVDGATGTVSAHVDF